MTALALFPSRIRFVNGDGTLTPEAYRALQEIVQRTGGVLGSSGADTYGDIIGDLSTNQVNVAYTDIVQQGTADVASGSASWTEVEIDFGSDPVYDATFTITDALISGTSKVALLASGNAATGRTSDDWQWDSGSFAAKPASGSATCYAQFSPGPIVGKRKLIYQIG